MSRLFDLSQYARKEWNMGRSLKVFVELGVRWYGLDELRKAVEEYAGEHGSVAS